MDKTILAASIGHIFGTEIFELRWANLRTGFVTLITSRCQPFPVVTVATDIASQQAVDDILNLFAQSVLALVLNPLL